MKQRISDEFWKEFEKVSQDIKKHSNKIINSTPPIKDSWTEKITSKIRISDLANELGIDDCPRCHYGIDFDDLRGWFICIKAKYESTCDFKGNIVDFMERCS